MTTISTVKKAFEINSKSQIYGSFAEIGAGQEVARHFFIAGHASRTIAKAMSAYDMVFSDEIYGKEKNGRYVCESRVKKMLDHEYALILERLNHQSKNKCFFTFADTVATNRKHGWMALRFQTQPQGSFNDVILHVNMKDNTRLQQTEALGHLGVNLIYACFFKTQNPQNFITSLTDNISYGRIEIDMIRFKGEDVKHFDNRLMCLELIQQKMTSSIVFDPNGTAIQPGDLLHEQAIFVQRGAFRPVTHVNLEISKFGVNEFKKDFSLKNDPINLYEITTAELHTDNKIDPKDFLDRVDCLTTLNCAVMVSDFVKYYQLKHYLRNWTLKPISLVIGGNQLDYFFDKDQCEDLEGGLFEGIARLFGKNTCVYVYPYKSNEECQTTRSFSPDSSIADLYNYLLKNKKLKDLSHCDEQNPSKLSSEVRAMMKTGDPTWESLVPQKVVDHIKENKLFGIQS